MPGEEEGGVCGFDFCEFLVNLIKLDAVNYEKDGLSTYGGRKFKGDEAAAQKKKEGKEERK